MAPILTIHVELDAIHSLKSPKGEVTMLPFHGECISDFFHGKILSGGVDTQIQNTGDARSLSARYMLEGTDNTGEKCHLFIENNGIVQENQELKTSPVIYTDSEALSWLETAELAGTVTGAGEGKVIIKIYELKY